jgi:RNA-binding protein
MALTPKQRSFLRGKAHHLSPVVMLGKEGLSEGVVKAVYHALRSHELIKVRVGSEDQETFRKTARDLTMNVDGAETVQTIGHNLVLFRPSTPPGKVSKSMSEAKIPYKKTQISKADDVTNTDKE